MRTRFLSLLAVSACLFTFTSCIEEIGEDLLISSESGLTQENLDQGITAMPKMAYGYLDIQAATNVADNELGHQMVVLTVSDVARDGRLRGTSDMMFVNLMSYGGKIAGTYKIGGNNATEDAGIAFINFCSNMNFANGTTDEDIPMNDGDLIVTENEDGSFKVAMEATAFRFGNVITDFEGALTPVTQ